MKFRTEIGPIKGGFEISHTDKIVMVGSCFADNIGEKMARDGFNVSHNPLGPLFNPMSISKAVVRGLRPYEPIDFVEREGVWHCLDYANRYQNASVHSLVSMVNDEYMPFARAIAAADVVVLTLGTAKVYARKTDPSGNVDAPLISRTVGNCHKFPGYMFDEYMLTPEEVAESIRQVVDRLGDKRIIITLSPVRYPGEGLPKGFLSKAILRVGIDKICSTSSAEYFPSFEIVNDDLRDYRFYAPDMKHPSEQAIEYIYEKFCDAYYSEDARKEAADCRAEARRAAHIPLSDVTN